MRNRGRHSSYTYMAELQTNLNLKLLLRPQNVHKKNFNSHYRLHWSFPHYSHFSPGRSSMRNARWLGIFALAFITTFTNKECSAQSESLLRVGKAINVFIRYGYLSISMKVISYNDTERWIFKEPTRNVFQVRCRRWRRRRRLNCKVKSQFRIANFE
jgi:hypothetical protein